MELKIDLEKNDEKMQKEGWMFFGPILHFKKGWKDQAAVYKKNKKYVISGADKTGTKIINEPISEKDAEKRVKESYIELRKLIMKKIKIEK